MASTALEYFRLFAKEFSAVPDAEVLEWIDIASKRIDIDFSADALPQAQAYLAACILKRSELVLPSTPSASSSPAPVGALIERTEGDITEKYSAASSASLSGSAPALTDYCSLYDEMVGNKKELDSSAGAGAWAAFVPINFSA